MQFAQHLKLPYPSLKNWNTIEFPNSIALVMTLWSLNCPSFVHFKDTSNSIWSSPFSYSWVLPFPHQLYQLCLNFSCNAVSTHVYMYDVAAWQPGGAQREDLRDDELCHRGQMVLPVTWGALVPTARCGCPACWAWYSWSRGGRAWACWIWPAEMRRVEETPALSARAESCSVMHAKCRQTSDVNAESFWDFVSSGLYNELCDSANVDVLDRI